MHRVILCTTIGVVAHAAAGAAGGKAGAAASVSTKAPTGDSSAGAEDRPGLAAPSVNGAVGLFRLHTAEAGPPMTFRVGFHTEIFKSSDFIVRGDEDTRFAGTVTFGFTPLKFLDLYAFFTSSANKNERDDDTRRDPEVVLALGDFGFGAKAPFELSKLFSAGPEFFLKFLNSVGGTSLDTSSTNVYFGAVASLDLHKANGTPFRAHLNAGFLVDKSQSLCPPTESDNPCDFSGWEDQRDRLAAEFGYGINRSRMQIALGVDAPLTKIAWPLRPILEYHVEVGTGEIDTLYEREFCPPEPRSPPEQEMCDSVPGRASQYLTVGVRVRPARGLFFDVGSDIGLQSPGFGFGPATPPWNLVLGLSYAYDPYPKTQIVQKEVVKVVEKPTGPAKTPTGRVRGKVADAVSGEPIEGAVVTFPGRDLTGLSTDPDGGFRSYDFVAGDVIVAVRHSKYEPGKETIKVEVNKDAPLEFKLTPAKPKGGVFTGRMVDAKGAAIATGMIRVLGAESKEVQTDTQGAFSVELLPGDYVARAEAVNYLTKERKFRIDEGVTFPADFVLSDRPAKANVTLDGKRKRFSFKKKIEFDGETATIAAASRGVLDEVVDILAGHPEVRKIRVEGFTDNRGDAKKLTELSQARADAVRTHLVDQGVEGDRIEAKGLGPAKPVAPNFTASGRAKNRRVEVVVAQ